MKFKIRVPSAESLVALARETSDEVCNLLFSIIFCSFILVVKSVLLVANASAAAFEFQILKLVFQLWETISIKWI